MSRFFLIALVLAEVNFRCVPTSACGDGDKQNCVESMTETQGDTGETEGDPMSDPMPDL